MRRQHHRQSSRVHRPDKPHVALGKADNGGRVTRNTGRSMHTDLHPRSSMDRIVVAKTADTEFHPSSSKDHKPVPMQPG